MPKSKSRVAKASPAPRKQALKKTTAARRKALEEKVNEEVLQGEADSDEGIEETQPTKPRGRPAAKSKTAKAAANQEAVSENEVEVDQTPAAARSKTCTKPTKEERTEGHLKECWRLKAS